MKIQEAQSSQNGLKKLEDFYFLISVYDQATVVKTL